LVLGAAAVLLAMGSPAGGRQEDPAIPGRAIVRIREGVPIGDAIAELEALFAHIPVTFSVADSALADRDIYLLSYEPASAGDLIEFDLEAIGDPNPSDTMEWAELLYEGHAPEPHTGSVWFRSVGGVDFYAEQYAAETLGLPQAQEHSTGQGMVVAVLDTGIDASHPLLAGSIAPGGFNFIEDNDNTDDAGAGIAVGHGTFVSGLIHLVAPDAGLLPIVVLDGDGVGDGWLFAKGMFYAIDQGVEVMNLSLGSTYDSKAVLDALNEANKLGMVVVAAAGNQNPPPDPDLLREYPAAWTQALGVAAVDDADVKADFSNYDDNLFISAPGTSAEQEGAPDGYDPTRTIYSSVPGGDYGIWEGTSLSTAFVSGAAALVRARHPEWPADEPTHNLMAAALACPAVAISGEGLGAGRVDAAAAVLWRPGDLDLDGVVGILDLLELLAAWGPCDEENDRRCCADLDGSRHVGIRDLLLLLGSWG
jgi:subtilisin family serine protease